MSGARSNRGRLWPTNLVKVCNVETALFATGNELK